MIKVVAFDMDNTLVATEPLYYESARQACKRFKADLGWSDYLRIYVREQDPTMRGSPGVVSAYKLLHVEPEDLRTVRREVILYLLKNNLDLMPYAGDVIHRLKRKYQLAICTNAGKEETGIKLERCCLGDYFATVITGDDVENSKPDKEMFLTLARRLDVKPSEIVAVGDDENDVTSALEAGCYAIRCPSPYFGRPPKTNASVEIKSLFEITVELIESFG